MEEKRAEISVGDILFWKHLGDPKQCEFLVRVLAVRYWQTPPERVVDIKIITGRCDLSVPGGPHKEGDLVTLAPDYLALTANISVWV